MRGIRHGQDAVECTAADVGEPDPGGGTAHYRFTIGGADYRQRVGGEVSGVGAGAGDRRDDLDFAGAVGRAALSSQHAGGSGGAGFAEEVDDVGAQENLNDPSHT